MNMIAIVLAVLIAVVAVFSAQNAMPVAISFLIWKFEASLAIIIFLSFFCGMVLGLLVKSLSGMRSSVRQRRKAKHDPLSDERKENIDGRSGT